MEFAYEQEAFIQDMLQLEPNAALQFFPTAEGFYDYKNNAYIYQYKDHLGNVRISYKKDGNTLEITDSNDYYPFGMNIPREEESIVGTASLYNYKYQGQELQETGFYSFKWRNYMPDVGRFFNVDPLAESFPYNSTFAFQENKLGMGVELEGLELLKNNTGYFAIRSNEMVVKNAPLSQTDRNGRATFVAGDIGLSTRGYNPNGARISTGNSGLRLNEYKYHGPVPDAAKMQNTPNKPTNSIRQSFKTTKTGSEMWNLGQVGVDRTVSKAKGVAEVAKLIELGVNIPNAIKSTIAYTQASKDVAAIDGQALFMDQAIDYVDSSGIKMTPQTKNDVVNYVFDGTLPNPGAGLMPNSLIIQNGTKILRNNNLPIQPLDEQLNVNKKVLP